ncbi:ABC transporter permease [candidate division CSSED10-310 bacterium]|uniref:ABC transporter permease n=1 Tax=candidate division CSSED10-310 bacterium TaxID=2855610 RepID=A0ABV6Z3K9_UNCC1
MVKNYLKIALRNLSRYKGYTIINVVGLAIGLACCILIVLFIQDEFSYDRHHQKAHQIYRVCSRGIWGKDTFNQALTPTTLAQEMLTMCPEVQAATRLIYGLDINIRYKERQFYETRYIYADSSIFDVFTIPLIKGDPETALSKPYSIVITAEIAHKYFGTEDPIGKKLMEEDGGEYTITGVAKNFPLNSHFHFDFLASLITVIDLPSLAQGVSWTYLVLAQDYPLTQLEAKLPALTEKVISPYLKKLFGLPYKDFVARGNQYEFYMQPLLDIHLRSQLSYELEANSNEAYVSVIIGLGFIILIITAVNFMNLATARSASRSREVGMRKVLGSNKWQLIRQFLTESILLSLISLLVALTLVELVLPHFNQIVAKELTIDYFHTWYFLPSLLGIIVCLGLGAGIYPAFVLSSFLPLTVMQGKLHTDLRNIWIRRGLLTLQLVITFIILLSAFILANQLQFIRDKNLGFKKERIVIIKRVYEGKGKKQNAFKEAVLQHPPVLRASLSNSIPGRGFNQMLFTPLADTTEEMYSVRVVYADHDFIETYQLKLAAGRSFSGEQCEGQSIIINETAAKVLQLNDALGKQIAYPEHKQKSFTIIGILKDFHFESLHQVIRPMALKLTTGMEVRYLSVRISPENIEQAMQLLKEEWLKYSPAHPFQYFFLDKHFDDLYKFEIRTSDLFTTGSILIIFIACLGLFGQTSFSIQQRTKEIGIRKVLGASVWSIVFLLSKEIVNLLACANLLAWPIAYLLMQRWLRHFAYRSDIGIWPFVYTALITMAIALITACLQTIKITRANPVAPLNYD